MPFRTCTAKKHLAVPFRFADTPAERAEFVQPDYTLVLTSLSHYYTGLTEAKLRQALDKLLHMGANAQVMEGLVALTFSCSGTSIQWAVSFF